MPLNWTLDLGRRRYDLCCYLWLLTSQTFLRWWICMNTVNGVIKKTMVLFCFTFRMHFVVAVPTVCLCESYLTKMPCLKRHDEVTTKAHVACVQLGVQVASTLTPLVILIRWTFIPKSIWVIINLRWSFLPHNGLITFILTELYFNFFACAAW